MANKRKSYTVSEKLSIIEQVKSGVSKAKLKREFGIPEGTIRGWMADEEKLRNFLQKLNTSCGLERKKSRLGKHSPLDDWLYAWFVHKQSLDSPVNGPVLKLQAGRFFKDLKLEGEFNATDGWLRRWKKRYGIGDPAKSPKVEVSKPKQLKVIIPTYQEAVHGLETAIGWLEAQKDFDSIKLMQLVSLKDSILKKRTSRKGQLKITDFFKK